MSKLVAFLFLVLVFAMPCQGGAETVVSSVADCRLMGGSAFWSNPALWTPMQVPDNNRPPGTTYNVSVPRSNCPSIYVDMPVTINELFDIDALYDVAKKPAKLSGRNVSLTVLRDARIDELNMTNSKLTVGGLLWISGSDGWVLTESKIKTQDYRQDAFTGNTYLRTTLETARRFVIADNAWADLRQSSIETQDLELSQGSLYLRDGSTVKVKGDFTQAGNYSGVTFHLNGQTSFMVEGNVQLAGPVNGSLTDGYVPSIGEEFPLLRCKGSISGSWTLPYPPPLPSGRTWFLVVTDHSISLKVVAAP